MKKLCLVAFTFIFLFDKTFSQGLIFDSVQFASRTSVKITRGPLPKIFSLKKFTPVLYPQVGSTCVAQSFATARTILEAKNLGWTDKQKITGLYFSPYYIYYRNKSEQDIGCTYGLNVEDAAKDVLKNGFAPLADVEYPNGKESSESTYKYEDYDKRGNWLKKIIFINSDFEFDKRNIVGIIERKIEYY